jgi:dethiobiotin synthetase
MTRTTFVITGTDTAVGKTVLAGLLARWLRERGLAVAALNPVSSGDRADARVLRAATGGALALDEVNPWHFRAPLAPSLAARKEGRRVRLREVLRHVLRISRRHDVTVVEGAGGLLSPLGERFDTRSLITGPAAVPVVVALNRLGAVNQVRLVVEALPRSAADRLHVVLHSPVRPDAASRSNPRLLQHFLPPHRIHRLPWLANPLRSDATRSRRVGRVLRAIAGPPNLPG